MLAPATHPVRKICGIMADGKRKYTLLQFQERLIDVIESVFGKDLDAKDTSQNKG